MIIRNIIKNVKLAKNGKPYASMGLQFDEYTKDGKRIWINGFGNKRTWAWKIGDDVQPTVTESEGRLSFTFDDTQENRLDVYRLPATVGFVLDLFNKSNTSSAPAVEGRGMPPEDIPNQDDIPF